MRRSERCVSSVAGRAFGLVNRTAFLTVTGAVVAACWNGGTPPPEESPAPIESPPTETVTPAPPPDAGSDPQPVAWPHLKVDVAARRIEIDGQVGINQGWLEQVACLPGTRVHESVVIARAKPTHVHAALLLIGLNPGRPGSWKRDDESPLGYRFESPTGDRVRVSVRYERNGQTIESPVREWIRDGETGEALPDRPWIFAGSKMIRDYGGREVYAADMTGSVVGLVTFGDEVLAWPEVLPDRVAVRPPDWEANKDAMPAIDAPVTLILEPWVDRDRPIEEVQETAESTQIDQDPHSPPADH